ncbi:hypothetical protein, partial [Escherichia coli]|uniref:hypothetical protein n=1 Tax=Escherichia coli TaxID=562 RepID=UPI001CCD100F
RILIPPMLILILVLTGAVAFRSGTRFPGALPQSIEPRRVRFAVFLRLLQKPFYVTAFSGVSRLQSKQQL